MWIISISKQPTLREVFWVNVTEDLHPPLLLLLNHLLLHIDDSPWMARLISLVSGIVLIPLSYIVARDFYKNQNVALLAAFIAAFSKIFVENSQLVRGYTLGMVFILLAAWCVVAFRERLSTRYLFWYFLAVLMALLCEFAFVPILPVFALTLLYHITKNPGARILNFTVLGLTHALLLVYLIGYSLLLETAGKLDTHISLNFPFHSGSFLLQVRDNILALVPYVMNILERFSTFGYAVRADLGSAEGLLVLFIVMLLGITECIRKRRWALLASFFGFLLTVLLLRAFDKMSLVYPRRSMGYVFVFVPVLFAGIQYIIAETGLKKIRFNPIKTTAYAALVCTVIVGYNGREWRQFNLEEFIIRQSAYDHAFSYLESQLKPGDIIVTDKTTSQYFWERHPAAPVGISPMLMFHSGYRVPLYYLNSDHRADIMYITTFSLQDMLIQLKKKGLLTDVKRMWFVAISNIGYKNYLIVPNDGTRIKGEFSEEENARFPELIQRLVQQQADVSNALFSAAPRDEVFYQEKFPQIKTDLSYPVIVAYPIYKETFDRLFLNAPVYDDPNSIIRLRKAESQLSN